MPRRRNASPLEDLFDLLGMLFSAIPPWTCIPIAITGFLLIWMLFPKFTGPMASLNPTMNVVGLFLGGLFAVFCLATGLKGWQIRKGQRDTPPGMSPRTDSQPECPMCRSPMVLRRARRGQNAGAEFWGCSKYPSCRGTRNLG